MTHLPITTIPLQAVSPFKEIGIVGAGLMGQGIARAHTQRGIPVLLHDVSEESLSTAVEAVSQQCDNAIVHAAPQMTDFSKVGLVIESITESLSIKKRVLSRVEKNLHKDAILTTNTSSIPITQIASKLQKPEQFCGLHFFFPVEQRALVEVVRGEKTSQQTIDMVVSHVKSLGKIPIVVKDAPGFVVNRFLSLYLNAALTMLQQGADVLQIDSVAEKFGMPIGPFQLLDAIGIDNSTRVGNVIQSAYPERLSQSELLFSLYSADYLGQKNGKGFYLYDENKNPLPEVDPFVKQQIANHALEPIQHSEQSITERLFLPQVIEATRILEEQIVETVEEIDIAIINGLGFPTSKGGILAWGDQLGAASIVQLLEKYSQFGEQFKPTRTLLECAITRTSLLQRGHQILQSTLPKEPLRKAG